jgi:hypothetical protein
MQLVLNDNVIRSLGHNEVTVENFVTLRDEGVTVHIADGAMGELANQLLKGRFPWQNWLVARDALHRFLDTAEPVLLGGRQGLYRAGIRGATDEVSPSKIASAVAYTSKRWASFMLVENIADITLPVNVGGDTLGLSPEASAREVAAFKGEWVESFDTQRIEKELLAQVQQQLPRGGDALEHLGEFQGSCRLS